jgi:hypothetical protein
MVKWSFEDDCLVPRGQIKIEYRGKDPFSLFLGAKLIIQRIFEIESKDFWERDFRWDITSDPRTFYIRTYGNKAIDARSKILVEVIYQGLQPSDKSKDGSMLIMISAKLLTEFNFQTKFQNLPFYRGLIKLYNFMFYNKVRRGYLVICNTLVSKLNNEFRSYLNAPQAK